MRNLRATPFLVLFAACTGQIADPSDPIRDPRGPNGTVKPGDPGSNNNNNNNSNPDAGTVVVDPPPPPFAPAPAALHRLTRAEYRRTLIDLFGTPLNLPTDLEVDTSLYGFTTVGASSLSIGPRAAEQYEAAALSIAEQIFTDPARRVALVGCDPAAADDPCIRAFIERFGRRAFRRPLDTEELDRWSTVVVTVAGNLRSVWSGIELAVAGLLQSPSFLYRVEVTEPDPADSTRHRYSGFEIAARLASFIWGTTPDETLLDAAAAGELDTIAGIERETRRLLASPRAKDALLNFFVEHLKLDRLETLSKDAQTFPQMSPTMTRSMRGEIERLVDQIAFSPAGNLLDLLDTRSAFVNDDLARIYNLPGISGSELTAASHPANSPRSGILTSAAFLALNAHETVTSPTYRGRFIRQSLLCQEIPPPPPNVVTQIPMPDPNAGPQTLRQRLETLHLTNPGCAGCHLRMDPLGFGLESFDAIGAYRTTDNGLPVDTHGDLDGKPFRNARELAGLLKQHKDLTPCITRMAYRYASGHLETRGEEIVLRNIAPAFAASGHRFEALILAIVTSDGFRFAAIPE